MNSDYNPISIDEIVAVSIVVTLIIFVAFVAAFITIVILVRKRKPKTSK